MKETAKVERRKGTIAAIAAIVPVFLASCADLNSGPYPDSNGAPYTDNNLNWPGPTWFTVVVRPGDTVSGIASRYDIASADVERMNRLDMRSIIRPGEVLRIPAGSRSARQAVSREAADQTVRNYSLPPRPIGTARTEMPFDARVRVVELPPPADARPWHKWPSPRLSALPPQFAVADGAREPASAGLFVWPVEGRVISPFGNDGNGERNDGINIAASLGAPIHAAASGTVTYTGNELKGYGNLVLIKHDDDYVTAYAHAQSISVDRGDHVEKGQIIGYAGATGDVDRPQLHFEIRKGAEPVNPKLLLAAR